MNKKTTIGQIWVPFTIALLIIGGMAYFLFNSTNRGSMQLTQWSDISLIFLLSPLITFSMVMLMLGIAFVFFMNTSHKKIHEWLGVAQIFSGNMKQKTQDFCHKTISIFSGPSEWLKNQRRIDKNGR
jgi:predicted membrane protein